MNKPQPRVWRQTPILIAIISLIASIATAIVTNIGGWFDTPVPSVNADELTLILEQRAVEIMSSSLIDSTNKTEFAELHKQNMLALKKGQFSLSHEITGKIQTLILVSVYRNHPDSQPRASPYLLYLPGEFYPAIKDKR